jgi:pimeloyl-ACP methyl ester carboxylesterase
MSPCFESTGLEGAVIALHCSGTGPAQWHPYRELLPAGIRFHIPALAGYGGAEWTTSGAWTLEAEVARIAPLLHEACEPVDLVGHAFGGAVALRAAMLCPKNVRSLTLYEPDLFHLLAGDPSCAGDYRSIVMVAQQLAQLDDAGRAEDAARMLVSYWSGEEVWNCMRPHRKQAMARLVPKIRSELEACLTARFDVSALAQSAIRVWLVDGDRSPSAARRVVAVLGRKVPQALVVHLKGSGHMAPLMERGRIAPLLFPWARAGSCGRPDRSPRFHAPAIPATNNLSTS